MGQKNTWNSYLTVEGMSQIISPRILEIHQSAHMTSGSICHLEPTSATPKVVTYAISLCAQPSSEISAGKEWDIILAQDQKDGSVIKTTAALPEGQDLVPSTHMATLNHLQLQYQGSLDFLTSKGTRHSHATQTNIEAKYLCT